MGFFTKLFQTLSKEDKMLVTKMQRIIGSKPQNLSLYKLALVHTSASKTIDIPNVETKESNERLEYLGDAILGAVIAEFLFRKYPLKEEGFLTEIRSRIVNRESLNRLAQKIGLIDLINFEGDGKRRRNTYKSLGGDALEALVGAVYLDRGFKFCKKFIVGRLLQNHIDIDDVIASNQNYKSMLIEWAQRENKEVKFEIIDEKGSKHQREFIAQVIIDDKAIAKGSGFSKKKAEQAAAHESCKALKILL